ncbi:MAG: hypothetical protein LBU07_06365 [Coriobacteriales bacterium]|nr:hypothetical protein [Coriobacteriales bacterium]
MTTPIIVVLLPLQRFDTLRKSLACHYATAVTGKDRQLCQYQPQHQHPVA